jgi:hypothetical protein
MHETVRHTQVVLDTEHSARSWVRIVENPRAVLLSTDHELWLYYHPEGRRNLSRWYFYYERADGKISQLYGPFHIRDHAQQFSRCQDYYRSLRWKESIELLNLALEV